MDKKYEVTAELKVTITTQDIDDIMVSALEGGVLACWCSEAEVVEETIEEVVEAPAEETAEAAE